MKGSKGVGKRPEARIDPLHIVEDEQVGRSDGEGLEEPVEGGRQVGRVREVQRRGWMQIGN
jgi:hypothetical protein